MVDYAINFTSNTTPGANTVGTFDDTGDLDTQINQLVAYFRTGGLAVKALGVSDWTSLDIIVAGNTYTYSR
jgi:hypothetical protein